MAVLPPPITLYLTSWRKSQRKKHVCTPTACTLSQPRTAPNCTQVPTNRPSRLLQILPSGTCWSAPVSLVCRIQTRLSPEKFPLRKEILCRAILDHKISRFSLLHGLIKLPPVVKSYTYYCVIHNLKFSPIATQVCLHEFLNTSLLCI